MLKGGFLMGKRLNKLCHGAVYEVINACCRQIVTLPLVSEAGWRIENPGLNEIVHEYEVASFLSINIPSFVAGPFGLMR